MKALSNLSPSQKRTAIAALIGLAVGAMVLLNRARTGQPLGGGGGVVDSSGQLVTDGYAGSSTFADNGQALGQLNSTITELIGQQTMLGDQLDAQNDNFTEFVGSAAAQQAEANAARAAQQAQFDAALSAFTASQQAAAAQPTTAAAVAAAAQSIPVKTKPVVTNLPAATPAQLKPQNSQGIAGTGISGGIDSIPGFTKFDAPGNAVILAGAPKTKGKPKSKPTNTKKK